MNINYYNSRTQYPNFKAVPVAKYTTGKYDFVNIYQLEKRDLPTINKIAKNMTSFLSENNITDASRTEIIQQAITQAQKILPSLNPKFIKTKIFIAEKNNKMCGILVGNIPKRTKNNDVVYSSRPNLAKKETELDWFTTWNPFNKKSLSGVGKTTLNEYLRSTQKEGFRDVFVRSETPEYSFAEAFYTNMGFETTCSKYQKFKRSADNVDLTGELDDSYKDAYIVPMISTRKNINQTVEKISKLFNREELIHKSSDLEDIIKI